MSQLSRRSLLKTGAATAATFGLGSLGAGTARAADGGPLFFLFVAIPDGMDSSYLFDARSLSLTAAGIKANYLNEEPTPWVGTNGGVALATSLTAPLAPYRQDFSVLNGVVMAASFDGHDQNTNFMLTGNPFGGDSFIPHLNEMSGARTPLDYVQTGFLFADVANNGASMPLSPYAARSLVKKLNSSTPLDPSDPVTRHLASRYAANAQGKGRFSAASALFRDALGEAPRLAEILKKLSLPDPQPGETIDPFADELMIVGEFFKTGATRSAILTLRPENNDFLDTHGPEDARKSGEMIGSIAKRLAQVIERLKTTPFDAKSSLFDRTVFVVGSEFGRTLRQMERPIDDTGTDHNPLTNSILIGGAGIKGGLVLGEGDTRASGEVLSGAHLALDPQHLKAMGKPFDFATMRASEAKPEVYRAGEYLSFASIANTLYARFGIGEERHWAVERNGGRAPVIAPLLG